MSGRRPVGGGLLTSRVVWIGLLVAMAWLSEAQARVVFETTSEYQRIRVVENGGVRVMRFDGAEETRMSVQNPLQGHFEYIELFHTPWLWHPNIQTALMIGLGGGSIQRHYQHYYPDVRIDTVEIDPVVVEVAKEYFFVEETDNHTIHVEDGRKFLEETSKTYDTIIVDAYGGTTAGDSIPEALATQEFFDLARRHLTQNGVLAYNVMGTMAGWRAQLVGSIYRTMNSVFPQVYLFPARSSRNVVLIATRDPRLFRLVDLRRRAAALINSGRVRLPGFQSYLLNFRIGPPPAAASSPLLTDWMFGRSGEMESLVEGEGPDAENLEGSAGDPGSEDGEDGELEDETEDPKSQEATGEQDQDPEENGDGDGEEGEAEARENGSEPQGAKRESRA